MPAPARVARLAPGRQSGSSSPSSVRSTTIAAPCLPIPSSNSSSESLRPALLLCLPVALLRACRCCRARRLRASSAALLAASACASWAEGRRELGRRCLLAGVPPGSSALGAGVPAGWVNPRGLLLLLVPKIILGGDSLLLESGARGRVMPVT